MSSSWEMQRGLMHTKVYCKFFSNSQKEPSHKPFKVAAAKKSICISLMQLASIRHYFLYKIIISHRFGATAMLLYFFVTSVLKKVHNNNNIIPETKKSYF